MGSEELLRAISDAVDAMDRARQVRDLAILAATEGGVERKKIAKVARLSEPMIYKIRRAELDRRAADEADLPSTDL